MKNDSIKNVNAGVELINGISGILTNVNPAFSAIPIFTFVVNRVVGFTSEDNIIKRLKKIEKN